MCVLNIYHLVHGLIALQKADINGGQMITFDYAPEDIRFVWPDHMDLISFYDKQAPLVLDRIDDNVFQVHIMPIF